MGKNGDEKEPQEKGDTILIEGQGSGVEEQRDDDDNNAEGFESLQDSEDKEFSDRLVFDCNQDSMCRETTFCDRSLNKCRPGVWTARQVPAQRCEQCRSDIKALLADDAIEFAGDVIDDDTGACMIRFISKIEPEEAVKRTGAISGTVRRIDHHVDSTFAFCEADSGDKDGEQNAKETKVNQVVDVSMHSGLTQLQLYTSPHFVVSRRTASVEWLYKDFYDGFTSDICQFGPLDIATACMVPFTTAESGSTFLLHLLNNWYHLPEWLAFLDADKTDRTIFEAKLGCLQVDPNMENLEAIGFMPLDGAVSGTHEQVPESTQAVLDAVWSKIIVKYLENSVPAAVPTSWTSVRAFIVEEDQISRLPREMIMEIYLVTIGMFPGINSLGTEFLPALWPVLLSKFSPDNGNNATQTQPQLYDCVDTRIVSPPGI